MSSALAAASLLSAPIGSQGPLPSESVSVDASVEVRAFHADAYVAAGGTLDLQVAPVQDRYSRPFLVTEAVPSADAPMDLGTGWWMVRDPSGHATVVMVDATMSLRDLQAALEADARLEVGTAIAFDADGARLVLVLDARGRDAFISDRVEFRPAASVVTGARAGFLETRAMVLPTRSFDGVDGGHWPIDDEAVWASRPGDGLWLDVAERADLLERDDLPQDSQGWRPFARLARPLHTPDGWVLEAVPDAEEIRGELSYDRSQMWTQRRVTWVTPSDDSTEWLVLQGTLEALDGAGVDPAAYGIEATTDR